MRLDRNEGRISAALPPERWAQAAAAVNRYPDTGTLTQLLAERMKIGPDQVLITAGGDDALEEAFRATRGSGSSDGASAAC